MMFMAMMVIRKLVIIFYICLQWFYSLENHKRYQYLRRKIMKDITIYDATGIERVMERFSINIASVFSKLIASLWCYCIMRKCILSQQGWHKDVKHGSILSSKGGPRKLQQQQNTKGVPERFNLIRMGGGDKSFFRV